MKHKTYTILKRKIAITSILSILITILQSCNEPNKISKEYVSVNHPSKESHSVLNTDSIVLIDSIHVKIGKQIWCLNNLDVDSYRNGGQITNIKNKQDWKSANKGAWCYFENRSKDGNGRLYNYRAVSDPRGLAPEGYHIPSEEEWIKLVDFLTRINLESDILKQYFFEGIEGVWRTGGDGGFDSSKGHIPWWSSSGAGSYAYSFNVDNISSTISGNISSYSMNTCGFYVRCIKNNYP